MKELVKFELYKVFTQKTIYFVAGLLLLATVFFLFQMRGPSLHSLYKQWEGPVTAQDIELAKKKDHAIAEKQMNPNVDMTWKELKQRNVYNDVIKVGNYNDQQKGAIHSLEQKIDSLKDQSGYTYRNLKLKKEMLTDIEYDSLYYQRPVAQIIDFVGTYGFVFLGALIVVGLSLIFTQESTTGVDQYMLSSKLGRRTIVHAKIMASLIFILIVSLILMGFDVVYWILMDGN